MVIHCVATPTKSCADCPIRHRAVCAMCDREELARLEQVKFFRTYGAGQTVVWRGDRMGFVASVVSGVATLSQTMEDGRRQMMGLLLPPDFLGRPGHDTAIYDVEAVTELTLCCFRRTTFERMMAETPHLGTRLLEMTLSELEAAREWMLVLGRMSARERVASLLLMLVRRDVALHRREGATGWTAELPLSRGQIADYLGTTLETVSRQLSGLKQDGVIRLDGVRRVHVPDLRRLEAEAGSTGAPDALPRATPVTAT